jgi:uncharacterized membrane protein YsdA (DUF1294 family)
MQILLKDRRAAEQKRNRATEKRLLHYCSTELLLGRRQ